MYCQLIANLENRALINWLWLKTEQGNCQIFHEVFVTNLVSLHPEVPFTEVVLPPLGILLSFPARSHLTEALHHISDRDSAVMKPNHLQQERQIFYISFTLPLLFIPFSHSNRLLLEFLHDFTSQRLHTTSMSALICSSSQPVVVYNASSLRVSISLPTPYFFPTSWSQAWVGWLLCHRIKRVTHTQKAYLFSGSARVCVCVCWRKRRVVWQAELVFSFPRS